MSSYLKSPRFLLCILHFFIVLRTLLLALFGKPSVTHRFPPLLFLVPLLLPIGPLESPDETPVICALCRMGVVSISKDTFIIGLQLVKGTELQGMVVEIDEHNICVFRVDIVVSNLLVMPKYSLVTELSESNLRATP